VSSPSRDQNGRFSYAALAEAEVLLQALKHIDAALSVLDKLNGGSSYTKPRHTLSASARKKISVAQKARWRTMSASARRKIAAFQRARWAKVKAQQKRAA
jgi:hypothetical protein